MFYFTQKANLFNNASFIIQTAGLARWASPGNLLEMEPVSFRGSEPDLLDQEGALRSVFQQGTPCTSRCRTCAVEPGVFSGALCCSPGQCCGACVDSRLPGAEGSALPAPTPLFWVWKCYEPRGAVLSAAQGLFGRVVGCIGPLQSSP